MIELTDRQSEMLEFVKEYLQREHTAPTLRDVCREFGQVSTNGPRQMALSLVSKGHLQLTERKAGLRLSDRYRVIVVDRNG